MSRLYASPRRKVGSRLAVAWLLLIASFFALAVAAGSKGTGGFEPEVLLMERVERLHGAFLDQVVKFGSHFGDLLVIPIVAAATTWLWRVEGKKAARLLILGAATAPLVAELIKRIVQRPRPAVFEPLVHVSTWSFPSGHTLTATVTYGFLASILWKRRHPWIAIIALSFVPIVAFSRVYLGVHYPTDVLGGFLAGLAIVAVLHFLNRRNDAELELSEADFQQPSRPSLL